MIYDTKLRLYLPSIGIEQHSSLIPLLGQAGINANLFKKEFLKEIQKLKITKLVIIPVHIFIMKNNDFTIKLFDPSIMFLIKISLTNNHFISLKSIYKIAAFRSRSILNLKVSVKSVIGTIRSMSNIKII